MPFHLIFPTLFILSPHGVAANANTTHPTVMLTSAIRSVLLAGALLFTALAPTLVAEQVAGGWHMQITLDESSGSAYLFLVQDGDAIHGTYQGLLGTAPVEGAVKMNELTFRMTSAGRTITYTGVVDGEDIYGRCDYAGATTCTFRGIRSDS
jgi:hypothetical protein